MRTPTLLVAGLLALTACSDPVTPEQSTATSPPGSLAASTTTTTVTATTLTGGPVRGALPNGVIYDIAFPAPRDEEIVEIRAGIVAEIDGIDSSFDVSFRRGSRSDSANSFTISVGEWTVEIEIPETVNDELRADIEQSVDVSTEVGMPVLTLRPPLHWAGPQEVAYDTFTVREGCPDNAVVCNQTHAVSVIPIPGVTLEDPISVQSYALRPRFDSGYMDQGPLSARWSPDVVWSGTEMIVWGGSPHPGTPHLIDGAAYAPATGEWRMLSSAPLVAEQPTRAIWTDEELVVIAEEATVAWDPSRDEWRVIAAGIDPPMDPGMTVWTGSEIITWTANGMYRLLSDGIDWASLPDPGVGESGLESAVLRVVDSRLVAIGESDCDRLVAQWDGHEWGEPDRISLSGSAPGCGHPNQTETIDGTLVMWDDTSRGVVSLNPTTGAIDHLASFPLPERDHAPGPLLLDGRFLVTAGIDGAIFDPASGQWTTVELPGLGTDLDMVWTGEEVLMWDKCCYGPDDIDAWVWVPPPR